jgi:hypothetical protein
VTHREKPERAEGWLIPSDLRPWFRSSPTTQRGACFLRFSCHDVFVSLVL